MESVENNIKEEEPNKKKRKFYRFVVIFLVSIAFFEVIFLFFAKPILQNIIQNRVSKNSDGVYSVEFDDLKINLFTGNILLTDFKFIPDTATYFAKNQEITENLYEFQLDTFQINQIRLFPLLKKENELSIKLIGLINPTMKVFAKVKKDTVVQVVNDNVSYEDVRKDVISKIFQYVTVFKVEQIKIIDGNFDFLKPRSDNVNQFSIGKVTFVLNNFLVDKNTFSKEQKHIFSENIEIIIADYKLKMNDNVHLLEAKKVYVNTKTKQIELTDIQMHPSDISVKELSKKDLNILDIHIDSLRFTNADFKEIYEENKFHLSKAEMNNLNINIYKQKIKKEKSKFNKDTLLGKIDIYPLFKNMLEFVHIDTLKISGESYNDFANISDNQPKTSIANFNIEINDFLVDSESIADTSRLFYAKKMEMNFNKFQTRMKDSIHSITIENIVASTENNGITAKSIRLKPSFKTQAWAILKHRSFNNISIEFFEISGFDFNKFSNNNEIFFDKIELGKTDLSLKTFPDTIQKQKKIQPLFLTFSDIADKISINEINIQSGFLDFKTIKDNRTTSISTNYRLNIKEFSFDPFRDKVTKIAAVQSVDFLLSNFIFDTPDELFQFSIDTLKYSTFESDFLISNLRLVPLENNIYAKLRNLNKSSIAEITIPRLLIANTNLSSAFQSDSLNLKVVNLNNPKFEITTFPNIAQKTVKLEIIDKIKRESINQIVRTSANIEIIAFSNSDDIDSNAYKILKYKKEALDSITKLSTNIILELQVKPKDIRVLDSSINVISNIEEKSLNSFTELAEKNLTEDEIDLIEYSVLSEINYIGKDYNSPKFNKDDIFDLIGTYLPKIISDSMFINNGEVIFKSRTKKNEKIIFRTKFNLNLFNLNFDIDSVDNNDKIFFADNFMFEINNTTINLKDNLNQLKLDKLKFNSRNSSIYLKDFSYIPLHYDSLKPAIIATVNEIYANNVDFKSFYFNNILNINEIVLNNLKISVNLKNKKNQSNTNKITYLFLPDILKKISVNVIKISNGQVSIKQPFNDTIIEFLSTDFNIKFHEFLIDSVTNVPKNTFFLPINDIDLELTDFNFLTKDTLQKISINKLSFSTIDELIDIKELSFYSKITDSIAIIDSAKSKPIISFYTPRLQIAKLNYDFLRFSKEVVFDKIQLDTPRISIFKPLKIKDTTQKAKFNIEEIDLYSIIKKNMSAIYGEQILITDIAAEITDCSDTLVKKQKFEKISLNIHGLEIDYSTTILNPNLFYSDNVTLTLKDYSIIMGDKKIKEDSLNKATLGKIVISTKFKRIELFNFSFKPIIPIADVWDKYRYRQAVMFVEGQELSINGLDFREILLNNKLDVNSITGDSIQLKVYVDKKDTLSPDVKPHLVELFLNAPIDIEIDRMEITNVDVFYEELNADSRKKAYININDCKLTVFRILNDSARIYDNDLVTIVKAHGLINDSAEITFNVFYKLKTNGNNAKITGKIGECDAKVFNTFTINGADLEITEGRFQKIGFNFRAEDTIVTGNIKMEYQDLNANLLSQDTSGRKIKKLISWVAGIVIRNDNPRFGVYLKKGKIRYIHQRKYSDISLWVKAILSGVKSTVAIDPSGDAKKIRKYRRDNIKNDILNLSDTIQ